MQFTQLLQECPENLTFVAGMPKYEIDTLLMADYDESSNGNESALYVLQDGEFDRYKVLPANVLLLFGSEDGRRRAARRLEAEPKRNIIYVSQNSGPRVINCLHRLLASYNEKTRNYSSFFRMIVEGKSLSQVLSEASRRCSRQQLVVIDFSGKIVASSERVTELDRYWVSFFEKGYVDAEAMQHFYNCLLSRSEISTEPYRYVCDSGLVYYSCPILINNHPYGYVFLLTWDQELPRATVDMLPVLSRIASDFIKKQQPELNMSTRLYRSLISDILEGESRESIVSRVKTGRFNIPRKMRVLYIRSYYADGEQDIYVTLAKQLSVFSKNVPPIVHRAGLVLILDCTDEEKGASGEFCAHLMQLARQNHLHIGVSNVFDDIANLKEYFLQASDAIRLSERQSYVPSIVFYKDVAFYSMLSSLKEGVHIRSYCHPALQMMKEYDSQNGTELFNTARAYVETGGNLSLTAKKLFTHRNTITYRRQQIADLTGVNFESTEEMFQLYYSFKIWDYLA